MAGISSAKKLVNIVVGLCGAGSPVDAELLIDPALDNEVITALNSGSGVGCRDDEADLVEIRILRACDSNKAKEVGNRAVIILTLDSLEHDVGDLLTGLGELFLAVPKSCHGRAGLSVDVRVEDLAQICGKVSAIIKRVAVKADCLTRHLIVKSDYLGSVPVGGIELPALEVKVCKLLLVGILGDGCLCCQSV